MTSILIAAVLVLLVASKTRPRRRAKGIDLAAAPRAEWLTRGNRAFLVASDGARTRVVSL